MLFQGSLGFENTKPNLFSFNLEAAYGTNGKDMKTQMGSWCNCHVIGLHKQTQM